MSQVDYIQGSGNEVTSFSLNINVGSLANRYVLAKVYASNSAGLISGVTVAGVAATQLAVGTNSDGRQYALYGAAVSATGSVVVQATWGASIGNHFMQVASYDNVSGIRGSAVFNSAFGNSPTLTVTTVAGDNVVMMGNDNIFGVSFTPSSPATLISVGAFNSSTGTYFACQETATGTSTVIDGTLNGNVTWSVAAVAMIPAGSAPIAFTGTVPTQNGVVGTAFSVNLSTYFSGNLTPFTYSLFAGTLPAGLTLNASTGVISGTPTAGGTATGIVVRGTDTGPNVANTNAFNIVIATVPVINTNPLRSNPNLGALLANTVIAKAAAIRLSDMTLIASWSNLTTNASGLLALESNSLVVGVEYLVVTSNATGTNVGVHKYAAV